MSRQTSLIVLLAVAAVLLVVVLVMTGQGSFAPLPAPSEAGTSPASGAAASAFDPFGNLPLPSLGTPRPCPAASEASLRAEGGAPFVLETTNPSSGLVDAVVHVTRVSDDRSGASLTLAVPTDPAAGALGTVTAGRSAAFSVYQPDQTDALLMNVHAGSASFQAGAGAPVAVDVTIRNGGLIVVYPGSSGQGIMDFNLTWTDGCRQFEGQASFSGQISP